MWYVFELIVIDLIGEVQKQNSIEIKVIKY